MSASESPSAPTLITPVTGAAEASPSDIDIGAVVQRKRKNKAVNANNRKAARKPSEGNSERWATPQETGFLSLQAPEYLALKSAGGHGKNIRLQAFFKNVCTGYFKRFRFEVIEALLASYQNDYALVEKSPEYVTWKVLRQHVSMLSLPNAR